MFSVLLGSSEQQMPRNATHRIATRLNYNPAGRDRADHEFPNQTMRPYDLGAPAMYRPTGGRPGFEITPPRRGQQPSSDGRRFDVAPKPRNPGDHATADMADEIPIPLH